MLWDHSIYPGLSRHVVAFLFYLLSVYAMQPKSSYWNEKRIDDDDLSYIQASSLQARAQKGIYIGSNLSFNTTLQGSMWK
jgi:hypothetical protein